MRSLAACPVRRVACSTLGAFLLCFLAIPSFAIRAQVPDSDRALLIDLFNSTNGTGWTTNTNWCAGTCPAVGPATFNAPGTECLWYGVTCSGGVVVEINLYQNHLTGTLPALASANLAYLYLAVNEIGGSIPELAALPKLKFFLAAENQFTGAIPSLTALNELTLINVSTNHLTGNIPSLAGLAVLQQFYVAFNDLSGGLPDMSGTSLEIFNASHNDLSGPIGSLPAPTHLVEFDVGFNRLSGPVPDLTANTNLSSFTASHNQLTGSIPPLTAVPSLGALKVDHNQLTGNIPDLAGTTINFFDASANQLTGSIPALSGPHSLSYFNVELNQLTGSIPDLTAMDSLQSFYVGNNRLSGPLPAAPAWMVLLAGTHASLCPNSLQTAAGPNDAGWEVVTGSTPWWATPFATNKCDDIFWDAF